MSATACRALPGGRAPTRQPNRAHRHLQPVPPAATPPAVPASLQPARRSHRRANPSQLELPFPPSPRGRYNGLEACAVEAALRACQRYAEGSTRQRAEVARLVELVLPEVQRAARALWRHGMKLSMEDLVSAGVLRLLTLKVWQRFTPGRAGRARTLFPRYATKVARQGMAAAIEETATIRVVRWGRRERAKVLAAQPKVAREVPYRQLVNGAWVEKVQHVEQAAPSALEEAPGATPAARAADALLAEGGMREAPVEAAHHVASTVEEELVERAEQQRAVAALQHLPRPMRLAVAAPMGLLKEGVLTDAEVARRLGKRVEQVLQLRARGLARLREILEE